MNNGVYNILSFLLSSVSTYLQLLWRQSSGLSLHQLYDSQNSSGFKLLKLQIVQRKYILSNKNSNCCNPLQQKVNNINSVSTSLFKEYGKGNTRPPRSQTITQEARAERRSHQIGRQTLLYSPSPSPPPPDNEDKKVIDKEAIRTVGMDRGIVCYCAGVECVFEMELYHYTHKQERDVSQECSV